MARHHHHHRKEEDGGIIRRHRRRLLLIIWDHSSHLQPVWCRRRCSHRHRGEYSASDAVLIVEAVAASSHPRVPMDIHHRQRHMDMMVMHHHRHPLMDILMVLRKVCRLRLSHKM